MLKRYLLKIDERNMGIKGMFTIFLHLNRFIYFYLNSALWKELTKKVKKTKSLKI